MRNCLLVARLAATRPVTEPGRSAGGCNILKAAHRSFHGHFQVGDSVLLKAQNRDDRPFWISSLTEGGSFESHQGNISHREIIGKAPRTRVTSSAGKWFGLHWPTLAEHCVLMPRVVTPIYPAECNTIVSLLDIHATTATVQDGQPAEPRLEILEAGTGHGALTLHLARAIHAANPGLPARMYVKDNEALQAEKLGTLDSKIPTREAWKVKRGAVIHSVDISSRHLKTAKRTVRSFGRGIYANDVEFHCSDLPSFFAAEHQKRRSTDPFLSRVVLDMPDAHTQLANVTGALKTGGLIVVFCPQVTQILDAVKIAKRLKLPLVLEQALEMGAGMTGGRQWDVRVAPRRLAATSTAPEAAQAQPSMFESIKRLIRGPPPPPANEGPTDWFEVCKPKLGEKVVNGGFIGVWAKTEASSL